MSQKPRVDGGGRWRLLQPAVHARGGREADGTPADTFAAIGLVDLCHPVGLMISRVVPCPRFGE